MGTTPVQPKSTDPAKPVDAKAAEKARKVCFCGSLEGLSANGSGLTRLCWTSCLLQEAAEKKRQQDEEKQDLEVGDNAEDADTFAGEWALLFTLGAQHSERLRLTGHFF